MTSGGQNFMLRDICRIHFHIRSNAGIIALSEVENLIKLDSRFYYNHACPQNHKINRGLLANQNADSDYNV